VGLKACCRLRVNKIVAKGVCSHQKG